MKWISNKFNYGVLVDEVYISIKMPLNKKNELLQFIADADGDYEVDIEKNRKKRSLDSNSYCWHIINEIANVLRANKDDIYFMMLKRYGQGAVVKIPNDKIEIFRRAYKYSQEHEKLTDKKAMYLRFWVGSSDYSTEEMSILIDGVVEEAKSLGIETMTPADLQLMKDNWKK